MSRSINGVSTEHMKVFVHNHVGGLSVVVAYKGNLYHSRFGTTSPKIVDDNSAP